MFVVQKSNQGVMASVCVGGGQLLCAEVFVLVVVVGEYGAVCTREMLTAIRPLSAKADADRGS
jgi:hypothetical protein